MPILPNADLRPLREPDRVLFIVNPGAGTGRAQIVRNIVTDLTGTDTPHEVVETQRAGHARQIAREAARDGRFSRLAAVGGDGTAMEVIAGTIGSEMPVSVVPTGTGNVIAVETTTPLDITMACTLALSAAAVVPFDLGWSGGKYFAARLGVGLEAETIRDAAHGAKKKYGRLGYVVTALKKWRQRRLVRYAIALDDQIIMRRAHTVFLTNVATVGIPGVNLSASVSPSDGHLDLCILRAGNTSELLQAVGSIVMDNVQGGAWEVLPVYHGVEIRTVPRQRVQVDGEPSGITPTMAAVLPHMVRLVVPVPPATAAALNAAPPIEEPASGGAFLPPQPVSDLPPI